jgi:hypothetical protein
MKKGSALYKAKATLKTLERMLSDQVATNKANVTEYERRLSNATRDGVSQAQTIADLRQSMARKDETIVLVNRDKMAVEAERDRIVRLTDQFLTVQILPLGSTTEHFGANQPALLRKNKA